MIEKIIFFIGDLVIPLLVGILLQRNNIFSRKFYDSLINLALLVVFPLLSVMSFWVISIDLNMLWVPLFGVLLHVVPGLLAYPLINRKYSNPADRGSFILSAILSNHLLVGGISAYLLFGETGFAYVQLAVLPQGIVLFLICFPLARYYQNSGEGGGSKQAVTLWSIFFNRNQIGLLGIIAGVLLNKSGIERPAIGSSFFDLLVHLNAWMSLVPVGHAIRFNEIRSHLKDTFSMGVIKFALTPLVIAGLSALLLENALMRNSLLVLAFTPTAINAVITVRLHNLNLALVMANFVMTTLFYVLIVYPILFVCLRQF